MIYRFVLSYLGGQIETFAPPSRKNSEGHVVPLALPHNYDTGTYGRNTICVVLVVLLLGLTKVARKNDSNSSLSAKRKSLISGNRVTKKGKTLAIGFRHFSELKKYRFRSMN